MVTEAFEFLAAQGVEVVSAQENPHAPGLDSNLTSWTAAVVPDVPVFSPEDGKKFTESSLSVTITSGTEDDGTVIYYTTDGSEPTTQSTRYTDTDAITVTSHTTIKAIAVKNNLVSKVASATYTKLSAQYPIKIIGPTGEANSSVDTYDDGTVVIQNSTDALFNPKDNSSADIQNQLRYWIYNGWTFTATKENEEPQVYGPTKTIDDGLKTFLTGKGGWTLTMDSRTPGRYDYPSSSSGSSSSGSSTYTVTVDNAKNGTVTVSPKNASKNTTVTITIKANSGYELDDLTVTDKNGDTVKLTRKSDIQYTFTMPASKITVEASFTKIEEQPTVSFVDVSPSAYYCDAVAWAIENGVTSGTSATTFSPDAACTRAQTVTFLWRAAGSPAPKSSVNPFADVPTSAYYYDAVLWAVEQGITAGTSATTFSPDATCTRGQIVTFLHRADGTAATGSNPFADVADSAYYVDAVKWAVAEGVTAGTSATTFSPDASCTRGQIVTFMYRSAK